MRNRFCSNQYHIQKVIFDHKGSKNILSVETTLCLSLAAKKLKYHIYHSIGISVVFTEIPTECKLCD